MTRPNGGFTGTGQDTAGDGNHLNFYLGDDEQTHVYILEELLDSKSHLLGSIWNMMMMIILMLVMMMMVVVVKKDG